eukprot:evm.model.scf_1035.3 EVM.evm.TU.scf_1035.3   scf_1035:44608-49511(-)
MSAEPVAAYGRPSVWAHIPEAPADPILGLNEAFKADPHPSKLNLGVGAYRTEDGKPLVLNVVRKAEMALVTDPNSNKEYLGIAGNAVFCRLSRELAFGTSCQAVRGNRIATVQSLSGTGALRVGAEFLKEHHPSKVIYLPQPTWGNHTKVFKRAGLEVRTYRYYDSTTCGLNFQGLMEDLMGAPSDSIILLHACAHNPTGVDPTPDQWKQMLKAIAGKQLLPFFDSAYQGFASGSLSADAAGLRMFADACPQLLLAQSYAKNMGMYGERAGALSVLCSSQGEAAVVASQLKQVIRPMYSNPPRHGAGIVAAILGSPELFREWEVELSGMADRIKLMRSKLHEALRQRGTPGSWEHILKQIGMFSYTGLSKRQVEHVTKKWHIYMTLDGRISMAGLSAKTCGYLADAMDDAVRNVPK